MELEKLAERERQSGSESSGDRRAGSVGERGDLAGSRDSGDRSVGSSKKNGSHSIDDEISGTSENDPGLGGA
jgi:hypothetical protein